jgi:hypothetical protein
MQLFVGSAFCGNQSLWPPNHNPAIVLPPHQYPDTFMLAMVPRIRRAGCLRVASLLWRLRRETAIETGLLQIQADILRARTSATPAPPNMDGSADILERQQ